VRVFGLDPTRDPEQLRRRIVQLQQAALRDRMPVAEAVAVFAAAHGAADRRSTIARRVGPRGHRRSAFATLSGGQRQRLFIALALIAGPAIAILDELTTGLDPAARRASWALIRRLHDRGTTVVLVTHSMDEAEMLCDRLAILVDGRIVAPGTPVEVRGSHPTLESAYLAITDGARRKE
jgi:ABC-2 type transport system ATP-binding protein